jgi:hypothetical protein
LRVRQRNNNETETNMGNIQIEAYRLAFMIIFAIPWPIRPHPNPTDPYNTPWIQNAPTKLIKHRK